MTTMQHHGWTRIEGAIEPVRRGVLALARWPRRILRRFVRDQRGGTAVQAIVMLPVIVLVFGMSIKLWQTLMIRRSLHTGTYLATRYLSIYPPEEDPGGPTWMVIAETIILQELANNPFVDDLRPIDQTLSIRITPDAGYACGDKFTVHAEFPVRAMLSDRDSEFPLPMSLTPIYLTEERTGEVLCE